MNISIFGLGYVGCVSVGCLSNNGHRVIGVDVMPAKAELINQGKPTIIEKDIGGLIEENWKEGRISATTDSDTQMRVPSALLADSKRAATFTALP